MFKSVSRVILVFLVIVVSPGFIASTSSQPLSLSHRFQFDDTDPGYLRVSGWEFQITDVEMAPTFNEEFSLGHLEDGRHWLVVRITGANTGSEPKSIHSDDIQLNDQGERIKQTGQESQLAADALSILSIGGSFSTNIDADQAFDFVQVYKVTPSAGTLSLDFDFNGIWNLSIQEMIAGSNPDSSHAAQTEPYFVRTNQMSARLISAVSARSFSGPFHLGTQSGLGSWTVVLMDVVVMGDADITLSDHVQIQTESSELFPDTIYHADANATRDVADELGIQNGTGSFNTGETNTTVILVFSTPSNMGSSMLIIQDQGLWYMDLGPVLDLSEGSPDVIKSEHPMDLSSLGSQNVITPTPVPTATVVPTPPVVFGSIDDPATIGDTILVEGFEVTLEKVTRTDSIGGLLTPRGGSTFIIIEIRVTRVGDGGADVGTGDFTLWNPLTDKNYSDSGTTFTDQPFRGADLAPGEYVYGQLAFEVPENYEVMMVRFRPAIWGDESYWGFRNSSN